MLTFVPYRAENKELLLEVDKPFRLVHKSLRLVYEGDQFIGVCFVRPRLNISTLIKGGHISICLTEKARGRDLGTRVMDKAIDILTEQGVEAILVQCKIKHGFTNKYMLNKGATKVITLFGLNYYLL